MEQKTNENQLNPFSFEPSEESQTGTGLKLFPEEGRMKVSGEIDLGYIGAFRDSQIEIEGTLEEIREWSIIREHLGEDYTDEEFLLFLKYYFNGFAARISRNIDNINGTFLLHVLTDMDYYEINFMIIESLFIEEKLFYGNEEDIAEVYNTVREGLKNLSVYLDLPNDGSIPKGHIETILRSFYPMFDFDCFIANIIPEKITLGDGKITFRCSDRFDHIFLSGAHGVIGEDLSIGDWKNKMEI